MAESRIYPYEAMFLLSQAQAADLTAAVEHINTLLSRAKAEVLAMRKWDERRLAYEIKKQKRGVYILVYMRAPAASISHLERDCNLSEHILRAMILRCDHLSEDEMRAADARDALMAEARLRSSEAAKAAQHASSVVAAGAPQPAAVGAGGDEDGDEGDGEQSEG